jgi:hypothetical protein
MSKKTGGAAFPRPAGWNGLNGIGEHASNEPQDGITVRDYFAAQALLALALNFAPDNAARQAYDFADAMIVERTREG